MDEQNGESEEEEVMGERIDVFASLRISAIIVQLFFTV